MIHDPPRTTDDGERIALGLEPIDESPTPRNRARAIAEALWEGNPQLGDAVKHQAGLVKSPVRQVRREASFFCYAHGLLLEDKTEQGMSQLDALKSHDWDALWEDANEPDEPRKGCPRCGEARSRTVARCPRCGETRYVMIHPLA